MIDWLNNKDGGMMVSFKVTCSACPIPPGAYISVEGSVDRLQFRASGVPEPRLIAYGTSWDRSVFGKSATS